VDGSRAGPRPNQHGGGPVRLPLGAIAAAVAAPAVLLAFLAGGVILNVLKEELPEERDRRFWAFLVGAAAYAPAIPVPELVGRNLVSLFFEDVFGEFEQPKCDGDMNGRSGRARTRALRVDAGISRNASACYTAAEHGASGTRMGRVSSRVRSSPSLLTASCRTSSSRRSRTVTAPHVVGVTFETAATATFRSGSDGVIPGRCAG